MELRPRKGRSAHPPSTPSEGKHSSRKPPQSVSRKKPASSPIFIPSDNEATDPKHNLLGSYPDFVQDKHESVLLPETPISEFVTSTQKALSSTIKQKKKAASHVKKKVTKVREITQQDSIAMEDAFPINDCNTVPLDTVHLDDTGTGDQICALKDADATKTITNSAYKDSSKLDREIIVKNCKNTQSAKKKSAAKSGRGERRILESEEVARITRDDKVDQVNVQEPDAPFPAVSDGCYQTLSLTLSDDVTAQASGELQVDLCVRKNLASTLEEDVQVQDSKASSKKKSRSNKKNFNEDRLSRKLFEESSLLSPDTEPDSSKEEETRMDRKKIEKSDKMSSEKEFTEEGIGSECIQTYASDEPSHRDPFSGNERGKERGTVFDNALEVEHDKMKGVATHIEDHNNTDDDNDSNASSSSDEDEAYLASIFASALKAHLHISEPSLPGKPMAMQSEQDVEEGENVSRKDAVKGSHLNGNNGRLGGCGLSWAPKVALSAPKSCRPQQAGPSKSSPSKIWEKDRCLVDGLCVPPPDPAKLNKLARQQKKDTIGNKWYNLSAPTITPELKKELQIVKLRGVLDPKRHYKAEDSKGLPKYFQVGTVIGGPADFYSGRLTKKEQKNSLANELLSNTSLSNYRKRKYLEIQDQKQAGGKGFMKKKKMKRTPAWAKI
ncbi:hypothetical protein GOP47_0012516 [Adiantum capillus-veneris]|uniref:Fcf2 pre-rRNA processing C-terminal domain-containing protein n=1 Tax=Adiantum capillus-veneris TaxID=13818 RepID=A0A9D4UR62_ADICA|nr:hypothetical protein GOP47_0012516 [Adiantum capillus-veneris]